LVVFTNGVFSLLHVGHVRLLQFAREQGDWLIVGINSDTSVRRIKKQLPIIPEKERAEILLAMECVDQVEIFDDNTPTALIERLRPDILVKGPEYRGRDIAGAVSVLSWGGKIVLPEWQKEHSTSRMLDKIKKR
jgi:D-beta-D-heptose 7-phosphate kinase / D-beta-D-heptose 1-phosphate adenosyltransferase